MCGLKSLLLAILVATTLLPTMLGPLTMTPTPPLTEEVGTAHEEDMSAALALARRVGSRRIPLLTPPTPLDGGGVLGAGGGGGAGIMVLLV